MNPDTLDVQEMEQYRQELGMEELVCKVGRALTPEIACTTVQAVRPVVMERICTALADQLLEGVPPEFLPADSDPEGKPAPPSPNGANGEAEDEVVPAAEVEPGDEAPSANGANGREAPLAAGAPAPDGNGSKRSRVTGRANPAGPRPGQGAPWPDAKSAAPRPEAGETDARCVPRERGPAKPGAPPPRE